MPDYDSMTDDELVDMLEKRYATGLASIGVYAPPEEIAGEFFIIRERQERSEWHDIVVEYVQRLVRETGCSIYNACVALADTPDCRADAATVQQKYNDLTAEAAYQQFAAAILRGDARAAVDPWRRMSKQRRNMIMKPKRKS